MSEPIDEVQALEARLGRVHDTVVNLLKERDALKAAVGELNERLHERTQGFLRRAAADKVPAVGYFERKGREPGWRPAPGWMVVAPGMSFQAIMKSYQPAETPAEAWEAFAVMLRGCEPKTEAQWEAEGWEAMWMNWHVDGDGNPAAVIMTSESNLAKRAPVPTKEGA